MSEGANDEKTADQAFAKARQALAGCPSVAAYAIVALDQAGVPRWEQFSTFGREDRLLRAVVLTSVAIGERVR